MSRNEAGLKEALKKIPEIRERFWKDVCVLGSGEELNQALERAGRVADFLELAELKPIEADFDCLFYLKFLLLALPIFYK